jgi:large subunit ribosomal protein L18
VRLKRHRRVRRRISGTPERPRLVVHRSLRNVTAQLVDDLSATTILGVNSLGLEVEGAKIEQARETGREIARRAKEKGITRVVFDRGGYLYHGRVQALAEGAREGGLEF